MLRLTPEEDYEIEKRCYEAFWGYDGFGSPGPKLDFDRYLREQRVATIGRPSTMHPGSFERVRHHRKGNGWKANHEGNI